MAVPKKKTSKSKRNTRKKTWKQQVQKQLIRQTSYSTRQFSLLTKKPYADYLPNDTSIKQPGLQYLTTKD